MNSEKIFRYTGAFLVTAAVALVLYSYIANIDFPSIIAFLGVGILAGVTGIGLIRHPNMQDFLNVVENILWAIFPIHLP